MNWEYCWARGRPEELTDLVEKVGSEGWEMVSATCWPRHLRRDMGGGRSMLTAETEPIHYLFFKRPTAGQPAPLRKVGFDIN